MGERGLQDRFVAQRAVLLRFLRARGGGDDAEDVLQDLWIKLQAARHGPVADPVAYLYRMADNLLIDRHRGRMRRERREDHWVQVAGNGIGDVSPEPSAETRLIGRERLARVRAQLTGLGERTERVFLRFRVDGIGQRAIAEEQGISVSAVEKHLHKAYRALLTADARDDADAPRPRRLDRGGNRDADG